MNHKNGYIMLGIGIVFLAVEYFFPNTTKNLVLQIPIPGTGPFAIVGTTGLVLTILSALRILDILPAFGDNNK